MPYAYPLDWSKMSYPANTGSGTPWGAPPSGERTCRGTSPTTVTLAKVLESSVLPKKEIKGEEEAVAAAAAADDFL
jgi:hypothetical protein